MTFSSNLFLVMSLALASLAFSASPAPSELRCELLKGDVLTEVVNPRPRFSWVVPLAGEGGMQRSYRVQVARARDGFDSARRSLIWDSGVVASSDSVAIAYGGDELMALETYLWRVRVGVGVGDGEQGHWSSPQRFTMASVLQDAPSGLQTQGSPVSPRSMVELEPGRFLIDFGKVAFGYLELQVTASDAGTVAVHFGERGGPEGIMKAFHKLSHVRYYEVALDLRQGRDVYGVHPPLDARNTKPVAIAIPGRFGRIAPFRFVEIESKGLELSDLRVNQIAIHYPWDEYASSFRSSNENLNALWDLCKYSMKATSFAGIYVDGDRERIPYEADAYINMLSHYAVDSEYSIGRLTHEYLMDFATWPTEWKQHSVMMASVDYLYTGDVSSLRRTYHRLKAEKTLEDRAREDGLLISFPYPKHGDRPGDSADIIDWPPVERDAYVFKEVNTVVNAFHYLNLRQMAQFATVLGIEADAVDYAARAGRVYQSFNAKLFDERTGLYVDGEGTDHSAFHANLFPLAFGLVPEERREKVASFVESKDLACSVYAAQYLLEALYEGDKEDAALRLMTMKGIRSWQNMLAVGSTITLEAWDDSFKPNQDWNHAWGAAPGNAIARYLLGVRPLEPGFARTLVAPRPGSLEFVEGRVPTIRGPVDVSVRQEGDRSMAVAITVPGNTQAVISLKVPEGKRLQSLTLNGEPMAFQEGESIVEIRDAPSGHYELLLAYE